MPFYACRLQGYVPVSYTHLDVYKRQFLSIALAFWLADLTHSYALGFLLVGVIYGLIGVIVFANRKRWLFLPFMDKFLQLLYRKQDDKIV